MVKNEIASPKVATFQSTLLSACWLCRIFKSEMGGTPDSSSVESAPSLDLGTGTLSAFKMSLFDKASS